MSVRVIEQRYCDVCEADYSDRPDWMILSAPNAPEDTDAQWDFCSYACLVAWINDDEDEQLAQDPAVFEQAEPVEVVNTPQPEAPRPFMTLADAIASGELSLRR